MSKPPVKLKLKAVSAKGGPTPAQREWLKKLGTLGGAPALEDDEAAVTGDRKALFGGLIPGIPDIIPDAVTSKITVKNDSNRALQLVLGSAKVETRPAGFVESPPLDIQPNGGRGEFSVSNALVGNVPAPVGTGGQVEYDVVGDGKKTRLFMKWERGFVLPSRKTIQTVTPKDDAKFKLQGASTGGDNFAFIFSSQGGTGPKPGPQPGPTPQEVPSSCLITVTNSTKVELKFSDQGHDRGDFMTFPPQSIAPGSSAQFVSVETPRAKEQGCKGFVSWEVGSPVAAIWRVEWDNPEQAKNTAKSSVEPQTAGFKGTAQIGQGEDNVPVGFTLSGGGEAPKPEPGPSPGPEPKPEPEPDFVPPPESKQPTLRKGDKSKDGWVEYLQFLLNSHLGINLKRDGDFGSSTHKAVLDFQKKNKLQVDGTVGNQTWAALRETTPEPPSTDGRKPHTFVEEGVEARWTVESDRNNRYIAKSDELQLSVDSVGDTPLDPSTEVTVRVTAPGAKAKVVKVKIGPAEPTASGVGGFHIVRLTKFKKTFPPADPKAKITDYLIEAFLPKELGGDLYKGKVREE